MATSFQSISTGMTRLHPSIFNLWRVYLKMTKCHHPEFDNYHLPLRHTTFRTSRLKHFQLCTSSFCMRPMRMESLKVKKKGHTTLRSRLSITCFPRWKKHY